jgi:putative phage-type endonuclease
MSIIDRVELIGVGHLLSQHPSNSPEWLAERRSAIGGSDVAVLMGKNPYKSAYTLWAERLGYIDEQPTNIKMLIGTIIEPSIIALFEYHHPDLVVHKAHTWAYNFDSALHANPDGFIENDAGDTSILEIKYTSQHWKELPEHYRLQVIWYQTITGLTNQAVVAAITADGYREFTVDFDKELSLNMIERAKEFLEALETETAPAWDGSESTLETVRAIHPDMKEEEVIVSSEIYKQLINAQDMQTFWTQQLNLRKVEMMKELNGAKWGYVDGEQVVSLRARGEGKPYLHIEGR